MGGSVKLDESMKIIYISGPAAAGMPKWLFASGLASFFSTTVRYCAWPAVVTISLNEGEMP